MMSQNVPILNQSRSSEFDIDNDKPHSKTEAADVKDEFCVGSRVLHDSQHKIHPQIKQYSKTDWHLDDLHGPKKRCLPLQVGDRAPNIRIPDNDCEMTDVVELSSHGSVLLIFHRGQWCPYDSLDLFEFQRSLFTHMMVDTPMVVISPYPDSIDYLCPHQTQHSFNVLNDADYRIAKTFGLVCFLPPQLKYVYERLDIDILSDNNGRRFESFIPAVYLIDQNCIVRKAYVDSSYIGKFSTRRCLMTRDEDYWLALV